MDSCGTRNAYDREQYFNPVLRNKRVPMMQSDQNQIEAPSAADTCLVRSVKQGDMAALEELVKRHTKRVFSIARHFTRSREDAEDVTQETFLKACCHLKDFRQKAQFSTWLTRIAVNTALTKLSGSKLVEIGAVEEPFWETTAISEEISQRIPNPEELCARSQLRRLLQKALEELPHIHGTVFVLRDVYGFSIAETAAALRLSVPQVKSRLFRARLQLRDHLSKAFIPQSTKAAYARVKRVTPFGRLHLNATPSELQQSAR